MSLQQQLELTQAVLLVTAGMLFFLTLVYIAATPGDPAHKWHHPPGWWKGRAPELVCPLHKIPRSKCTPESHADDD